jgi:integrase
MVLLQAMFALAVERGEITSNPVALVRKAAAGPDPGDRGPEPRRGTRPRMPTGFGDLFSATLVSVLAYAGVRPGEALALERRHVRNDTPATIVASGSCKSTTHYSCCGPVA